VNGCGGSNTVFESINFRHCGSIRSGGYEIGKSRINKGMEKEKIIKSQKRKRKKRTKIRILREIECNL